MTWEEGMLPELKSPPPRLVRRLGKAKFATGLFSVLGIGLFLLFAVIAYFMQQKHNALRDHGQAVVAKLIELKPRQGKSGPYLVYGYDVEGKSYTYSEHASSDEFNAAQLGQPLELMYLPESPGSAETANDVRNHEWSNSTIALLLTSALITPIMFIAWWFIRRSQRRHEVLLRDGVPTWSTGHTLLSSYPKYDQYKFSYEYVVDGVRHEGKSTVNGAAMQALHAEGSRTAVLYDPLDPARSDLYAAIVTSFRIEDAR